MCTKKAKHILQKVCSDLLTPIHQNTALVSNGISLTLWGKGASLALIGHLSSDAVTIKITYEVMFCYGPCIPSFPIGFVKTESELLDKLRPT